MFFIRVICITLISSSVYAMHHETFAPQVHHHFPSQIQFEGYQHISDVKQALYLDIQTLKQSVFQLRQWMIGIVQEITSLPDCQYKQESCHEFLTFFRRNSELMDTCITWAASSANFTFTLNYLGYALGSCGRSLNDASRPETYLFARELIELSQYYLRASLMQSDFLTPKICEISHSIILENSALLARYDQQYNTQSEDTEKELCNQRASDHVQVSIEREVQPVSVHASSNDFEQKTDHDQAWKVVESNTKKLSLLSILDCNVEHQNSFACIADYDEPTFKKNSSKQAQQTSSKGSILPKPTIEILSTRECEKELIRANQLYAQGSEQSKQEAERIWEHIASLQSDDFAIKKQIMYACGQLALLYASDIEQSDRALERIEKFGFSEINYYRAVRAYQQKDYHAASAFFTKYLEHTNSASKRYRIHAGCYKTIIASHNQDPLMIDALACLKKVYQEIGPTISFQEYEPLRNPFFLAKLSELVADIGKKLETADAAMQKVYGDWAYFAGRLYRDSKHSEIKEYCPDGMHDLELFAHAAQAGNSDAQEIVAASQALSLFERMRSIFSLLAQESLAPAVRERMYKANSELAAQGYFGALEFECARIIANSEDKEVKAEALFKRLDKHFPQIVFGIGGECIPHIEVGGNLLDLFAQHGQHHWSARVLRSASILVALYNNLPKDRVDESIKRVLSEIQFLEQIFKEHEEAKSTLAFAYTIAGTLWNYKTQQVGLSDNPSEACKAPKTMEIALKYFDKASVLGDTRGKIFRAQSYILSKGLFKEDQTEKGITLLKEIAHKDPYHACEASLQLCTYFISVGDRYNAQKYFDSLHKFPDVKYDQRIKKQVDSLKSEIDAIEEKPRQQEKKREQKTERDPYELVLKGAVASLKEAQKYCDADPRRAFAALKDAETQLLFSIESIDDCDVMNLYERIIARIKESARKAFGSDQYAALDKACDDARVRYHEFRMKLLHDHHQKIDATIESILGELDTLNTIQQEYSQIMLIGKREEKKRAFADFIKKYDVAAKMGLRNVDVENCMVHQTIMCNLNKQLKDATRRLTEISAKEKALFDLKRMT